MTDSTILRLKVLEICKKKKKDVSQHPLNIGGVALI